MAARRRAPGPPSSNPLDQLRRQKGSKTCFFCEEPVEAYIEVRVRGRDRKAITSRSVSVCGVHALSEYNSFTEKLTRTST